MSTHYNILYYVYNCSLKCNPIAYEFDYNGIFSEEDFVSANFKTIKFTVKKQKQPMSGHKNVKR